jgi:hypothetical protein
MTIDFALPLITGIFLGGIVTEVRWVMRVRQFQNQLDLNRSKELEKATTFASAEAQGAPQEAQSSLSLHSLRDHLTAEAGKTPAKEAANVAKREL